MVLASETVENDRGHDFRTVSAQALIEKRHHSVLERDVHESIPVDILCGVNRSGWLGADDHSHAAKQKGSFAASGCRQNEADVPELRENVTDVPGHVGWRFPEERRYLGGDDG